MRLSISVIVLSLLASSLLASAETRVSSGQIKRFGVANPGTKLTVEQAAWLARRGQVNNVRRIMECNIIRGDKHERSVAIETIDPLEILEPAYVTLYGGIAQREN